MSENDHGINVYNPNKEKVEKINNIYLLRGKKQESVDIRTGDIAVAKLQVTMTGDTLCDQSGPFI